MALPVLQPAALSFGIDWYSKERTATGIGPRLRIGCAIGGALRFGSASRQAAAFAAILTEQR